MSIKKQTETLLNDNSARFFMPGHKGALSFYDITEIDGADNLVCPNGEIMRAQQKIADIYGADESFISVNGSSAALIAAITATCANGSIAIDRQCHISAINAMLLGRVKPAYIHPVQHEFFGVGEGITPSQVSEVLVGNPDVSAVLITSPTYYGVCSDIRGICNVAHKYKIPVIVDAAHGAHFNFSDKLPDCAVKCGADIVIHSTHKTLCCLTQGAVMHASGALVDKARLKQSLNMVLTTSPSYLIMSSVEESITNALSADFDALVQMCDEIRSASRLACLSDGFFDYDKTRLVFNGKALDVLMKSKNIITEMYDGCNAVLLPSVCTSEREFKMLRDFVSECETPEMPFDKKIPSATAVIPPYQAYYAKTQSVNTSEASGRISAQAIYTNPPCMPVICPGELISDEVLQYINQDSIRCVK